VNYYEARQIINPSEGPSGLWHYTCKNGRRVWPVGHCAEGCPGHPTKEEAEEHYRQYLIEHAAFGTIRNQQRKCQKCGAWTQGMAQLGPGRERIYILCEEHQTREVLQELVPRPTWAASSW
jgi:hypothetical protein